ncbi:MAG: hypothetical protein EOO43_26340 [Flavobacterium sp.]|nr:MAG: hypothetical protein EOO43_26340 [Flavobacterium sp.]
MGDKLTPLVASSKKEEDLKKLADGYDKNIDSKLEAKRTAMVENAEERQNALQANKVSYDRAVLLVDNALSKLAVNKGASAQVEAIGAIQESAKTYSRIGATTRASIPESFPFAYDQKMTLRSDKVGSIDFSLNSAFSHLNHWAVWLSLFLAFFIDIGVPLVVRIIQSNAKESDELPVFFSGSRNSPKVL